LYDKVDDEVSDAWEVLSVFLSEVERPLLALTLIARQNPPSCEDNIVQNLKSNVYLIVSHAKSSLQAVGGRLAFCLWVARLLEDFVNEQPCVGVLFEL